VKPEAVGTTRSDAIDHTSDRRRSSIASDNLQDSVTSDTVGMAITLREFEIQIFIQHLRIRDIW
jgi:hypothetical protein